MACDDEVIPSQERIENVGDAAAAADRPKRGSGERRAGIGPQWKGPTPNIDPERAPRKRLLENPLTKIGMDRPQDRCWALAGNLARDRDVSRMSVWFEQGRSAGSAKPFIGAELAAAYTRSPNQFERG
jgi:hypothetical protein